LTHWWYKSLVSTHVQLCSALSTNFKGMSPLLMSTLSKLVHLSLIRCQVQKATCQIDMFTEPSFLLNPGFELNTRTTLCFCSVCTHFHSVSVYLVLYPEETWHEFNIIWFMCMILLRIICLAKIDHLFFSNQSWVNTLRFAFTCKKNFLYETRNRMWNKLTQFSRWTSSQLAIIVYD